MLAKPVKNPYFNWIKSGIKTYEGRLATKVAEWGLTVGAVMIWTNQDDPNDRIPTRITELLYFPDFGAAFNVLGFHLMPYQTREEVVENYNALFHYPGETLIAGTPSQLIQNTGVVAIGFEVDYDL